MHSQDWESHCEAGSGRYASVSEAECLCISFLMHDQPACNKMGSKVIDRDWAN